MKYAVISISGAQYKVSENDTITVNKLNLETGKNGSTDQVLLISDDNRVLIGNPTVKGAKVDFEIIKSFKGKKLDISTYKAKSRYHRHLGFRPMLTDIKITKITS